MLGRPFVIAGKIEIYLSLSELNRLIPITLLSHSELGNDTVNLVDIDFSSGWHEQYWIIGMKGAFGKVFTESQSSMKMHIWEKKSEIIEKFKQIHCYRDCRQPVCFNYLVSLCNVKIFFKCWAMITLFKSKVSTEV